ncbi:hypothetical protein PLICRDRAFT_220662 [Plicaturopsis crispa FD-325 SS-3]|nr:hypothetical protein PLICRDRAFT_220662 [Plicaturopsis crispa FD-325 SS-3]
MDNQEIAACDPAPSSQATSTTKRHRLQRDAVMILNEIYAKDSRNPRGDALKILQQRIAAIPGNEHCTTDNIRQWFGRRRRIDRESQASEQQKAANAFDPRWPSITKEGASTLEVLFEGDCAPRPAVIEIWKKAIGSELADVTDWVRVKQASLGSASRGSTAEFQQGSSRTQLPHLPTPSQSTSPGASLSQLPSPTFSEQSFEFVKYEPQQSPVVPRFLPQSRQPSSDELNWQPPLTNLNAPQRSAPVQRTVSSSLRTALSYARSVRPPSSPIRDLNDFSHHFEPYEEKMRQLQARLENGPHDSS